MFVNTGFAVPMPAPLFFFSPPFYRVSQLVVLSIVRDHYVKVAGSKSHSQFRIFWIRYVILVEDC